MYTQKMIFGLEQMELVSFLEDFPQIAVLIQCLLHTKILQQLQYFSGSVSVLQTEDIKHTD